jgi:hypothetical protein
MPDGLLTTEPLPVPFLETEIEPWRGRLGPADAEAMKATAATDAAATGARRTIPVASRDPDRRSDMRPPTTPSPLSLL